MLDLGRGVLAEVSFLKVCLGHHAQQLCMREVNGGPGFLCVHVERGFPSCPRSPVGSHSPGSEPETLTSQVRLYVHNRAWHTVETE